MFIFSKLFYKIGLIYFIALTKYINTYKLYIIDVKICIILNIVGNNFLIYNKEWYVGRVMMENIKNEYLHQKYVTEVLDEKGMLKDIKFSIPEDFNFGFDVVDAIAEKDSEKLALVWESNDHDVKKFTFCDISRL